MIQIKYDIIKLIQISHENIEKIFGQDKTRDEFDKFANMNFNPMVAARIKSRPQKTQLNISYIPEDLKGIILNLIKNYNVFEQDMTWDISQFELLSDGRFMSDGIFFYKSKKSQDPTIGAYLFFTYNDFNTLYIDIDKV